MKHIAITLLGATLFAAATAQTPPHFSPKGKQPSATTVTQQEALRKSLPLADKLDFEEARRGFIGAPGYRKIMADAGNVAWDMGSYDWLLQGKDFNSIHPSLQRQAVFNMEYGL